MSYQRNRDQFIAVFAQRVDSPKISQGPGGIVLSTALLRCATTLQRLAEAQCNGDWPYDNGQRRQVQPCGRCQAGTVPTSLKRDITDTTVRICPDCRCQDRVRRLLAGTGWVPYFQGDPRGCVLWIHPDDGQAEGRYMGNHPQSIAVPGRY